MTAQMLIRMDPELKNKITRLAMAEGKNTSEKVRELIEDYVKEHDISTYVDDLWSRIGKKLRSRGKTPDDVARAVKEVRKAKR